MNTDSQPDIRRQQLRQQRDAARHAGTAADRQPADKTVHCIQRSERKVGKIKCGCSSSPSVYRCDNAWVASGYCTPADGRTHDEFPPDGPIVLDNGDKITPAETRMKNFISWPLQDGEVPQTWHVVVCQSCPQRVEPPPHVLRMRELGIHGQWDRDTGHAEIVCILEAERDWPLFRDCAPGHSTAYLIYRRQSLQDVCEITRASLVVLATAVPAKAVTDLAARNPQLQIWIPDHLPRRSPWADDLQAPNLHAGILPDDARVLEAERSAAYRSAVTHVRQAFQPDPDSSADPPERIASEKWART